MGKNWRKYPAYFRLPVTRTMTHLDTDFFWAIGQAYTFGVQKWPVKSLSRFLSLLIAAKPQLWPSWSTETTITMEEPKWSECQAVYPPPEEIVKALQDLGTKKKEKKGGKEVTKHKFAAVEKVASKIYNSIRKEFNNPEGLTKNTSRGRTPLLKNLILNRRHVDITETDPFFHQYGKEGKVFIITNTPSHSGIDVAIDSFQEHIKQQLYQKNVARTSNDGLRLGCVLLDPKHRGTVSGLMTKKKDRKKADQTGDPALHFFQKIVQEDFLDPNYEVSTPSAEHYDAFPEDEKGGWDPNHPSVFEHSRDGNWLKATWEEYVRPKYKKALDKWNKDTGGGDGTPASFIDFCGGDRWLVWLFCKDHESNFLLASNAGGRMPSHLQVEAGFEDLSSLGDSTPSAKREAIEDELAASKNSRQKLDNTMERVVEYLDKKTDKGDTPHKQRAGYIKEVADYSRMMQDDTVLDSMSPDSRGYYLDSIKKQRKEVLNRIKGSEKE